MTDSSSSHPSPNSHAADKASASALSTPASSAANHSAPSSHNGMRRSLTVDEGAQLRARRQPSGQSASDSQWDSPGNSGIGLGSGIRRRSSTFSEYSLNEARRGLQDDILNPGGVGLQSSQPSTWASTPLVFALLPAVGGIFFQDGSHVITDIMLLGLAAVFLHWSVTQPWIWYHSAQEVRVREETFAEMVIEDESDGDSLPHPSTPSTTRTLDDVPEEEAGSGATGKPPKPATATEAANQRARQARRALNELYAHEVLALLSCFGFPVLGAYLLHAIRNQLSRPSEGLVNNYNLTIFILASEIHPLSHLIKLVQARTLHLQRVVHGNPFHEEHHRSVAQWQEMARRIDDLETRAAATAEAMDSAVAAQNQNGAVVADSVKQQARMTGTITRDVRNAIQPELDALNRAVRRYEKKATVLAFQTEARLGQIDIRLGDAVALAAAAAKHSAASARSSSSSFLTFLGWLADMIIWTITLPFTAVIGVVTLPFRTLSGLFFSSSRKRKYHERGGSDWRRERRTWKVPPTSRMSSSDRVPSRLSKR